MGLIAEDVATFSVLADLAALGDAICACLAPGGAAAGVALLFSPPTPSAPLKTPTTPPIAPPRTPPTGPAALLPACAPSCTPFTSPWPSTGWGTPISKAETAPSARNSPGCRRAAGAGRVILSSV